MYRLQFRPFLFTAKTIEKVLDRQQLFLETGYIYGRESGLIVLLHDAKF